MSCEKPVNSPLYLDTSTCNYNDKSSAISDSKRYRYLKVGITNASQVEESCKVEKMFRTSWPRGDDSNISCKDVHNELVYGFELHGSKESVKVIAQETAIIATSMIRTVFNTSVLVGK